MENNAEYHIAFEITNALIAEQSATAKKSVQPLNIYDQLLDIIHHKVFNFGCEVIMIRGCQKRMYCMKNPGGLYFEEVYFVLKNNAPDERSPIASLDLAGEAERIIKEASAGMEEKQPKPSHMFSRAAAFALGAASSSAVIGAVALLIATA